MTTDYIGRIPGTILDKEKMGNVTGMEFLNKVFYITNGIMLAQIREITGIDGTTLQNWVKRGWVSNSKHKSYHKEQVARIILINMMRDAMQLSKIASLLISINGTREEDVIISEAKLYDYVCLVLDKVLSDDLSGINSFDSVISDILSDYVEPIAGAKRRIAVGIKVIVLAYYATILKAMADATVDGIL